MTARTAENVVRPVILSTTEDETLKRISHVEHLDEEALLKKFVRDGLARYRLEHAIRAYARGKLTLGQAAHHAEVSVEDIMSEMEARGVYLNASAPQFLNGLESLANTFGGSPELHQLIRELRAQAESS